MACNASLSWLSLLVVPEVLLEGSRPCCELSRFRLKYEGCPISPARAGVIDGVAEGEWFKSKDADRDDPVDMAR